MALGSLRATTVLGVLSGVAVAAFSMPTPAAAQANSLERGRYLVEPVAFCGVCHATKGPDGSTPRGMELAGGRVIAMNEFRTAIPNLPPGQIRAVVPNITPDLETGIGRWKDDEIATAIREGRRPDASIIGPPMPIAPSPSLSDTHFTPLAPYLPTLPPLPTPAPHPP